MGQYTKRCKAIRLSALCPVMRVRTRDTNVASPVVYYEGGRVCIAGCCYTDSPRFILWRQRTRWATIW
jgi:hypothetical protein